MNKLKLSIATAVVTATTAMVVTSMVNTNHGENNAVKLEVAPLHVSSDMAVVAKATNDETIDNVKTLELEAVAAKTAADEVAQDTVEPTPEKKTTTTTNKYATNPDTGCRISGNGWVSRRSPPPPTAEQIAIMAAAGIDESDYQYVNIIVTGKSEWDSSYCTNSGEAGLCAALPASKMASFGDDYITNPVTQLKWCSSYVKERFGSWRSAGDFYINTRNI